MTDNGKGSRQRPTDRKKWSDGYDRTFHGKDHERDARKCGCDCIGCRAARGMSWRIEQEAKGDG